MEKHREFVYINYVPVPSLQNLTVTRIAISLWKQSDFSDIMAKYPGKLNFHEKNFMEMTGKVLYRLSLIPVPKPLKEKLPFVVKAVGLEMFEWVFSRYSGLCFDLLKDRLSFQDRIFLLKSLSWTTMGTIDEVRVFDLLLQQETDQSAEELCTTFKTACIYCMEDQVSKLWEKLQSDVKIKFKKTDIFDKDGCFIAYWSCAMDNELHTFKEEINKVVDGANIYSMYEYMLKLSIGKGIVSSVRYFWSKYSSETPCRVMKWLESSVSATENCQRHLKYKYSVVMCFMLSQVKDAKEQQTIVLKHGATILKALLQHWQWNNFLSRTIQVTIDHIDENDYISFMAAVVVAMGSVLDAVRIFVEVWSMSHMNLRKTFIKCFCRNDLRMRHPCCDIILRLLAIGDIEVIIMVLEDATVDEKETIFISTLSVPYVINSLQLIDDIMKRTICCSSSVNNIKEAAASNFHNMSFWCALDSWESAQKLINWCFSSEEQMKNFKSTLDEKEIVCSLVLNDDFQTLNGFLNWYCTSDEQRVQIKREVVRFDAWSLVKQTCCQCWGMFKKLITWCFSEDSEGLIEFKVEMQQQMYQGSLIFDIISGYYPVTPLFCRVPYTVVEQLLQWCFESVIEIKKLKNHLILTERAMDLFFGHASRNLNFKDIEQLVNWYQPLEMSVIKKFKKIVKQRSKNRFDRLFWNTGDISKNEVLRLLDRR